MQKLMLILILLTVTGTVTAQQTIREVTNATSTTNDSKLNSDTVPEVYTISGQFERILIVRFKFQTDLLTGLDSIVKQYKIRNAVILSGIGSVIGYHFHTVSNRTFPTKNIFVKDPMAPADISCMNGYVINGRVHAHVTFTYADKAFGGHLEPGTEVFTFAVVTIGVLNENASLENADNKDYR